MRDYTDIVNKSKKRKEKDVDSTSSSAMYDATPIVERIKLEKSIGLDTFSNDFTKVNQTIQTLYGGWQTQETMNNTLATVDEMRNRLALVRKYKNKYAQDWDFDVDGAIDYYEKAIEGWGNQTELYKGFQNADAFDMAKTRAQFDEKYKGKTFDEIQSAITQVEEGSNEHSYLKGYTNYTNLEDFDKALAWAKGEYTNSEGKKANTEDKFKVFPSSIDEENVKDQLNKKYPKGNNILDLFPSLEGSKLSYPDESTVKNATKDIVAKEQAGAGVDPRYVQALERAKNVYKLDNGTNDYYAKYREEEDFEELSQYKSTKMEKSDKWYERLLEGDGQYGLGYGDITYEYINDVDGIRSEIKRKKQIYGADSSNTTTSQEKKGYDKLYPEEIAMYNYLYQKKGKEAAQQYLDEMEVTLTKRVNKDDTENWNAFSDDHPILSSALSIPANIMGGVSGALESVTDAVQGKEYNPYGYYKTLSNYATTTRRNVGENIAEATEGMELLGTNVPSFLYQTGMSIGDTVVGGGTLGTLYSVVAGSSAFQQKAKELTEAGESQGVVVGNAMASGLAEMVFEYLSLDKLIKIDGVDGLRKGIKATLKQAGIEGSEELATELANIGADVLFRGDNNELAQLKKRLLLQGYSEEEANKQVWEQGIRQVAEAFAGGMASGGVMGGGASIGNYAQNKSTGASIKANAQTETMWDTSAMTPEESETYKLYTEYANKGINAGNIKDAQLGNLYNTAESESYEALGSKKSKEVDKLNATTTLNALDKVSKPNTEELRKQRVESLSKGEVTEVTATGNSTKIEGIKKVDGDLVVTTSEGEFKADEITFSDNDAELLSYAENMEGEKANMFVSMYDGTASVDAYHNSFNLAVAYAENNISQDTMLENRGVLTPSQVGTIYTSIVTNKAKAQSSVIAKLMEKHGNTMSYNGTIDDSVIDYNNKTTDGSKVNWKDLTDSQRKGVTFLTGLAKATGLDAQLITDGLERGMNGAYMVENGKIIIDVYAGVNKFNMNEDAKDTIIPALAHELTHWSKAKSPEKYQALSESIFKVLTKGGKGEAQLIDEEIVRLRKNGIKADVEYARDEIIARACEDLLSMSETGKEMFNNLSETEQKSLVAKIKDIINDLVNWVNELLAHYQSKSKEAEFLRQYKEDLQDISKQWDAMLKEAVAVNQAMKSEGITDADISKNDAVQNSDRMYEDYDKPITVEDVEMLRSIGRKSINEFTSEDIQKSQKMAHKFFQELGTKSPFFRAWFGDWREHDTSDVKIVDTEGDNRDRVKNKDTGWDIQTSKKVHKETQSHKGSTEKNAVKYLPYIDDITENAILLDTFVSDKNNDNSMLFHSLYAYTEVMGYPALLRLRVEELFYYNKDSSGEVRRDYILQNIEEESISKRNRFSRPNHSNQNSSTISVADLFELVKQYDTEFKPNPVNEALVNEDGTPKVMYHGTANEFTVFNPMLQGGKNGIAEGYGIYFTDKQEVANAYANEGKVMKGYLKVTNPATSHNKTIKRAELEKLIKATCEAEAKRVVDDGEYENVQDALKDTWVSNYVYTYDMTMGQAYKEVAESILSMNHNDMDIVQEVMGGTGVRGYEQAYAFYDILKSTLGIDGFITEWENQDSPNEKSQVVVAFESNQFKSVDNIGTFDSENPDIRYSDRDSEGNQLTKEQVEFFKDSKVRDENGNIVVVYHGTVREFYTFDRAYGNVEGDMGKGFYFTNSIEDVERNYANEDGADLTNKIEHEADILENEEEYEGMSHDEIVEVLRKKYITSEEPITLDCYLNIKNPCYVGRHNGSGETYLLEDVQYEYDIDDFDDEDDYHAEIDQIAESYVEDIIYDIESNIELYDYDAMDKIRSILVEAIYEGGIRAEDLRNKLGDLYLESEEGIATSEVLRIIIESLGYDGIIDSTVSMKFKGMGLSKDTVHYIVFNSNQAKLTTNTNPTDNEDIRYSDRDTDIDTWLDDLSLEELESLLDDYDFLHQEDNDVETEKPKKQRAKRRVDEVNKRLKEIGLSFNGTKTATWTDERIDKYLDGGYYASSNPNYAQAYITYMTPKQFLYLTVGGKQSTLDMILRDSESYGEIDFKKLGDSTPLFLEITEGKNVSKVVGHEGRHRMYLLGKAGFEKVPVLLFDYKTKYDKSYKDTMKLSAQRYNNTDLISRTRDTFVSDVIPFSQGNRDLIIDKFGSGNQTADIRYSDRIESSVYEILGENDALKKRNEILSADIQRLRERVKLEGTVTKGKVFDANQLHGVAVYLNKTVNSAYNSKQLAKDLERLYSYIAQSENIDEHSLFAKCQEIARDILSEQRGEKVVDDYYKGILDDLRSRRISLSEEQINEVKSQYGDRYRNAFMGKITIAKDGISLDSVWQELSQMYPEVFDAETTEADQPLVLLEIYDSARESSVIYQKYNDSESTMALATEIYNKYWTAPRVTTIADKYDAQIKKLNFEHRKAMSDLRTDFNDRLQKQKTADAIHYGKIINDLRKREKTRVQEAKEFGRRRVSEVKERAEKNAKIKSITDKALTLNKWLVNNSKDEHIIEPMKPIVAEFLNSIDFSSRRSIDTGGQNPTQKDIRFQEALHRVHKMMQDSNGVVNGNEALEYYGMFFAQDFVDEVGKLCDSVRKVVPQGSTFTLNDMSLEDLNTLDTLVSVIKKSVREANTFHTVMHKQGVESLAIEEVEHCDELGEEKVKNGTKGVIRKFVNWGNALPVYVFDRLGEAGQKIFRAFQDGWDKFAFNVNDIIQFSNDTYAKKEVRAWEKEIKTIEVGNGKKIKLSTAQIMALHCLNKREQARLHIYGDGIRIADIEDGRNTIRQTKAYKVTEQDVEKILSVLTERQVKVADALQEFMNTVCTEWGNEITMKLYGIKMFGEEEFYFPIQINDNNKTAEAKDNENSIFRLLNMSFTKKTDKNARNDIMIKSIFDVFAQHTSDMAKYNALALPVSDTFKWYNYKSRTVGGELINVKTSLESAFGNEVKGYITTFLKHINGEKNVGSDILARGMFQKFKIASVGANLRVMALQPTAYVRAMAVINPVCMAKAFSKKPNIKLAKEYCGMALWKSLGFYDTNIQRGLSSLIKHDESVKDKIVEASMFGTQMADDITWGYLWNACEYEVKAKRKDLKVDSEEFKKEVANKLRDVIYRTQVVDSTMTRSEKMRTGDGMDNLLTAFASEPTLSLNMLLDCRNKLVLDARKHGIKKAIGDNTKHIARTLTAYTLTATMCALVEAGFDIMRDEEEDEEKKKKYGSTFLNNLMLDLSVNTKLPFVKDIVSLLQGYSPSVPYYQWAESMVKALDYISRGKTYKATKYSLKAFSYFTGLPVFNLWRDTVATADMTQILSYEELKDIFSDSEELKEFFDKLEGNFN